MFELFLLLETLLELDFFDDELLEELTASGVSITRALSVISFPLTVTVVFPWSSIVTLIFSLLMLYPAGALVSFTVYVPAGNPLKPTTPAAFETAVRFFPFPVSSNVAPDKPSIWPFVVSTFCNFTPYFGWIPSAVACQLFLTVAVVEPPLEPSGLVCVAEFVHWSFCSVDESFDWYVIVYATCRTLPWLPLWSTPINAPAMLYWFAVIVNPSLDSVILPSEAG